MLPSSTGTGSLKKIANSFLYLHDRFSLQLALVRNNLNDYSSLSFADCKWQNIEKFSEVFQLTSL